MELARLAHDGSYNNWVLAVAWSPDGRFLAVGLGDPDGVDNRGDARLIEAASAKELTRVAKTARIFEAASGKELLRLAHDGAVAAVTWSPNGRLVATGSGDGLGTKGEVRVVEAATGKELTRLAHDGRVNAVAWSPDGRLLAIGLMDFLGGGEVRILDAATGDEVANLAHDGGVLSVAWSPDGRLMATGSSDKTARVLEAATGKDLARVPHDGAVRAVAWSPDGTAVGPAILTGSDDRTARVWRIFPTAQPLVDAAKERAARCLTPKQRAQYFVPPAPPTWCVARRLWPYHGNEWQAWLPLQKAWLASGRQGEAPPLPKAE
jgi:WD40 repeat protein